MGSVLAHMWRVEAEALGGKVGYIELRSQRSRSTTEKEEEGKSRDLTGVKLNRLRYTPPKLHAHSVRTKAIYKTVKEGKNFGALESSGICSLGGKPFPAILSILAILSIFASLNNRHPSNTENWPPRRRS